jgi:hypothetical protein
MKSRRMVRNAYNILIGKHEGKRSRGRPKRNERRWEGVDWMYLAQNRDQCWALVNMVMNLPVP